MVLLCDYAYENATWIFMRITRPKLIKPKAMIKSQKVLEQRMFADV